MTRAQSLVACVIATLLIGCGDAAEARPKRTAAVVRLHTVDASIQCEMADTFAEIKARFEQALPEFVLQMGYRGDHALEQFGLLTVDHFWDGSLYGYWKNKIPPEPGVITLVALPALYTQQGKMYGGMASNVCKPDGGWAFVNAELGDVPRNSLTMSHEIAHLLGATDHCQPDRTELDPLCAEDAYKAARTEHVAFTALSIRQMARCLGYRKLAGRVICVGKCRKNKRAK